MSSASEPVEKIRSSVWRGLPPLVFYTTLSPVHCYPIVGGTAGWDLLEGLAAMGCMEELFSEVAASFEALLPQFE